MHTDILDSFGRPDSLEWRHRQHSIRANSHPIGRDDRFLVWNRADQLVAEVPSLQAARRWIDGDVGA